MAQFEIKFNEAAIVEIMELPALVRKRVVATIGA